jgi:hypothetical protein
MPVMSTQDSVSYTFGLTYEAATQQLHGCWRSPVPEDDLYGHYAELMDAAEMHQNCRFWLLDMRARNWHAPNFGWWFGNEFAAIAQQVLGQSLFIAYVLSPTHKALADSLSVQATQCNCAAYGVYPFFFDNEAAARDWLAHQQAHDLGCRATIRP